MKTSLRIAVLLLALVSVSAASAAAGPAETTLRSRQILTAHQLLRGEATFRTPATWVETEKSGVYTAQFTREAPAGCAVSFWASIRGKATRQSPAAQAGVAWSPRLAEGPRRDGRYALGEQVFDGPDRAGLYGIAIMRVAKRRYGQLRVFATLAGPGCTPELRRGPVADEVEQVLRTARSHLRVARTK